jgi:D-sedoheptulose 7-phosphate isomerase
MSLETFFTSEFAQHQSVLEASQKTLLEPFSGLVEKAATSLSEGGKIMFFGNGGSAADAQHLATELVVRFKKDRAPMAALALTTDTSALSAIGNDFGFDDLFSRQIYALLKPGDLAIGISTSGNSENVIRGLKAALDQGGGAAGFGGGDGGRMTGLADPFLLVPSKDTARIQEMHILLGHMLCSALETRLGLVAESS